VKGRAGVLLKVVSRGTPDTPNSAHGHRPTVRTGPFQTCAYNDTIQACAVCTGREACDLLPVALVACRLRRRSGDVAEGGVVQSLARLRRRAQFKANANACQRIVTNATKRWVGRSVSERFTETTQQPHHACSSHHTQNAGETWGRHRCGPDSRKTPAEQKGGRPTCEVPKS